MNQSERDELIFRMSQQCEDFFPRIEAHLGKINGHLDDHSKRLTIVEVKQEERNKLSKKSIAGISSGIIAVAIALWKAFLGST